MANPFVHVELNSNNVAKAREFYQKLFDWKLEDMPMGPDTTYTVIKTGDDKTGGGMFQNPVGPGSAWIVYVAVDDIDASVQKIKDLGGTINQDVTEIPDMGRYSVFTDPSGATLALFEATKQ